MVGIRTGSPRFLWVAIHERKDRVFDGHETIVRSLSHGDSSVGESLAGIVKSRREQTVEPPHDY